MSRGDHFVSQHVDFELALLQAIFQKVARADYAAHAAILDDGHVMETVPLHEFARTTAHRRDRT
jgi:hypothetical protein